MNFDFARSNFPRETMEDQVQELLAQTEHDTEYHDSNRYLARIRLSISIFILILVIPELACSDLAANYMHAVTPYTNII